MTEYVCGFAFDNEGNVALIRKERPQWQKGSLNGIGGHVEAGESDHEAMVREFEEETGLLVPSWELFVTLKGVGESGGNFICAFYRAFNVDLTKVKTMTDEEIVIRTVSPLSAEVLFNLQWLVPLALDREPLAPNVVIYG